ncbi:MAG: hypothetical protein MUF64_18500 [Polyangiaceae bacterium]|nr:hypothetical protein [Polyangiaceae bacterium]
MIEIRDRRWTLKRPLSRQSFEGLRLVGCTFDNCGLASTDDPGEMTRISKVELIDCSNFNSQIGPCYLDDVRVENLKTGDLMLVWAPMLTHVTLAGKTGSIKINEFIRRPGITPSQEEAWRALRRAHHAQVDWALDISAVRPLGLEIAGVPAAKIRRDPETQVVVTRARLHDGRQLDSITDLEDTLRFTLTSFVKGDAEDAVFVAPTGRPARAFKPVLRGFEALRRAGLAEPD